MWLRHIVLCGLLGGASSALLVGQGPARVFEPVADARPEAAQVLAARGITPRPDERVWRVRPRVDVIAPMGRDTRARDSADRITLDLPPGRALSATRRALDVTDTGTVVWRGVVDGDAESVVILAAAGGVLVGEIYLSSGEYFRVDVADAGDALIRASAWPTLGTADTRRRPAPQAAPRAAQPAPQSAAQNSAPSDSPADLVLAADDGSVIDVLIVYTPGARDREGGEAALRTKIDAALAGANDGYSRSQIVQRLRLVHAAEIAYTDTGNDGLDLTRLQQPNDGYLGGVHALRDQYRADLVMLLTRSAGNGYYTGLAYVMDGLTTEFAPFSFSLCTAPLAFLFGHEFAHNMGAAHGDSVGGGLFGDSRGFTDQRSFETLMGGQAPCAGSISGCARLMQLSNPSIVYQGTPTGVANVHDNARTLNASAATVAKFRTSAAVETNPDADGDSLPTAWEIEFGLDPGSPSGANGPAGDPDGDGRSNADELSLGTHPRGFNTRYFAEGSTRAPFDTRLALANPSTTDAIVLVRYQRTDGTSLAERLVVPARARRTVRPAESLGLTDFSSVVESDERVLVDRTMTWDASGYGSHAETGVAVPATAWYLAEGATHSGFDLFYLLQNPSATETAHIRVRYLLPSGGPLEQTYVVGPGSRRTVWVDEESFGSAGKALSATDVSGVITVTNGVPVIVERAMYLSGARSFGAGHESAGVTEPRTSWFLAEGATGDYFDEFLLLANPSAQAAQVRVSYLLPGGGSMAKDYTVRANSRFTIWVDLEEIGGARPLANTAVSAVVTSTNGVGVIAERAMWWPGGAGTWQEAHNSAGAAATGTRWGVADGEGGGAANTQTYVLVANTSAIAGSARVTLLFEDGTAPVDKTLSLPPSSRTNVDVSGEFPAARGRRFGVLVESVGASPAQIVVERAMYSDAGGVRWAAGTHVVGARLP